MANQLPEFVYRLVTTEEWGKAEETGVVPLREIDRRDGYVHLSLRRQVIETANMHFSEQNSLLALEVAAAPIATLLKLELAPKRGEGFPHLYGELRRDHVRRVLPLKKTDAGFAFREPL